MMDNNVGGSSFSNDENGGIIKEQDRLLPIANVGRIMKQILPQNAKISKESKETMQECVSEFISFVTSEASEKCRKERRKTVNGDDICWALGTLGFDDYAEPMRRYLHRYRELEHALVDLLNLRSLDFVYLELKVLNLFTSEYIHHPDLFFYRSSQQDLRLQHYAADFQSRPKGQATQARYWGSNPDHGIRPNNFGILPVELGLLDTQARALSLKILS
ncbi:putative transcription factor Hap3/NF-YB family [Medicago truncatula]|uniref:Nuclear transcription factor Y subunit B16 n=1 Tax=Medicago truncatula TaxID=3880 RepID=I3TAX4_MEDTR|nr:nuclear transcription factor Y subunit B-10 [Medicago truncatula]AFK49666.1 nuclear transcription factor Y subunit B16 [Medicago truncatula]RHN64252.1 putative transcription factor Hap3/NF-YB family [Medicago truncatula]